MQLPKHLILPEESKDEEEPAQDSSVNCEEDDNADNAEVNDDLEEDEEREDRRGVGVAEGSTSGTGTA